MNGPLWTEIGFILLLILVNGFFAASEIAVVSSRRSRIQQWAKEKKSRRAALIAGWLKEPESFLATVQIFVSLVGALASALGGVIAVERLRPRIVAMGIPFEWSEPLSLGIVVIPITYCSLVIGELAPKSLALIYRERMALLFAYPLLWLSALVRPLASFLTLSTRAVLLLLGKRSTAKEMFASEEEIRFLIQEGGAQGIFDTTEQQMIPKVFDFAEMRVKDVMIPREQISALNAATPRDLLLQKVAEEGYTRLPVYQGNLDRIIGILHMKDLIHIITLGRIVILQDLVRPAVFVPRSSLAKDLLLRFQKQHLHLGIVQDEAGKTLGLVTLEDLIERIVGDIRDEHDLL